MKVLAAAELEQAPVKSDRSQGRLLVVEDEDLLLETTAKTLMRFGHEVATARDGQEALAILAEDDQFDVVFSDVVMPGGVSGFDLKRHCDTHYPHLTVLLTSGYNDFSNHEAVDVLTKPYTHDQLIQLINRHLLS
ncbi:MAG: two-component system response regulator [Idiomarinaceae bacterium]|nr:two-component system response regulator [Idiomarinaceae bacterium]